MARGSSSSRPGAFRIDLINRINSSTSARDLKYCSPVNAVGPQCHARVRALRHTMRASSRSQIRFAHCLCAFKGADNHRITDVAPGDACKQGPRRDSIYAAQRLNPFTGRQAARPAARRYRKRLKYDPIRVQYKLKLTVMIRNLTHPDFVFSEKRNY